MNFFKWEFSSESEPELNKFLQVVSQNKNPECKLEKKMLAIFPEIKDLQHSLENSKSFVESKNTTVVEDDDIITVEDDENMKVDENMEIKQEIKTDIPDVSLLNFTQTTLEDTLDANIDVFIEYLLECLENQNLLLENEYITKLVNDYNNYTLNYLFNKLTAMSEKGVYNLNKSICKHAVDPLKNIPELFCKIILLPKLQNINPTKTIITTMSDFCETFPEVTRQELIVLFLVLDSGESKFFQTIINMLSETEKQNLLRDFVYIASEIEIGQISILETLFSAKVEDNVKRRLINLMEVSADKFKTEKLFMKLLIVIINNLESGFEDQEQIIFNIIEKSKTANRLSAQKALKKWVGKFSDD